jgi:hypothetical protein
LTVHHPFPQATRVPKVEKFKYLVPTEAVAVINRLRLAGPSDLLPFASQHETDAFEVTSLGLASIVV